MLFKSFPLQVGLVAAHRMQGFVFAARTCHARTRLTEEQQAERAALSREEKIRRQENTNID